MLKRIAIIGFLSLAVPFSSYANDSDRINQLEKELQEIKLRLTKLESLLSNPSKAQELVTSGDGWKSVVNWRKLSRGMDPSDVRKILGEPHRVEGGPFTRWYYQNDGTVTFHDEKVYRWEEPRE